MSFISPPEQVKGELISVGGRQSGRPNSDDALRAVQKTLRRSLDKREQLYIQKQFDSLGISGHKYSPSQLDAIYTRFSGAIKEYFADLRAQRVEQDPYKEQINVHDMLNSILKADVGQDGENANSFTPNPGLQAMAAGGGSGSTQSRGNTTTAGTLSSAFLASRRVNSRTLLFDSRYRYLTSNQSKLVWNVLFDTRLTSGYVNAYSDLNDITKIRVFPIMIPLVNETLNNYNLITLSIDEFSSQSITAHEGRQYMFMFQVEPVGRWLQLNPYYFNKGVYELPVPIRSFPPTLTLSFGTPMNSLDLDLDRQFATVSSYGVTTELTFSDNHNLENGDNIYITNFTTLNPTRDSSLINAINTTNDRLFVTRITDTVVSIDIDSSSLRVQGAGTVSATTGSAIVTGVGSNFISLLTSGDFIEIAGGQYQVSQVVGDTSLTLKENYTGTNQVGVNYWRNNRPVTNILSVFFGSKRIFIQMEFMSE